MRLAPATLALLCTTIVGCAAEGPVTRDELQPRAAGKIQECKAGDRMVDSESACLLDDAACYRIADGNWCTGPRGNVCPAGSSALPTGAPCPPGGVCFRMGESLDCLAG